ncbi:MAG: tryptophan synthase subunit alpha [Saprospiraceae bacterium]|nr:tryptophan synthase subunit alpha [Saprospiraceae bacterium]
MGNNSIREKISAANGRALNVYFTAGYPTIKSIAELIRSLEDAGADLIELGMPYSDPLADGITIQNSSKIALENGLNLKILFEHIAEARKTTSIPIIMMGYFNQLLQFGVEDFLKLAANNGVAGMIIPDLPMNIYERDYKSLFEKYDLSISFLISPMTSDERIKQADRLSSGFIYVVSQSSITGKKGEISEAQKSYFDRIESMNLKSPRLIGFGIHDRKSFDTACTYSDGAIVGSAFIRALANSEDISKTTHSFIQTIK